MIRLATFNVNSVRSRLPILERWLPPSGVDALFLQETKVVDADFPVAPFEAMGYGAYFRGEKSYNGVAAMMRKPLTAEVSFGFADEDTRNGEPDFPTRVMLARIGDITVLNTYVPQGKSIDHPDFEVKKRFLARVRKIIEREFDKPFVWVGDLNVAPTEQDVTNPKDKKNHVCFCEEIRACFERTREGLVDLPRAFHPEGGEFTFFDYRVKDALERGIGWRIDHALASPALAERAAGCHVDTGPRGWDRPSDHTPLVVEFS